jgi:hypothetical protein
MRKTPPRSEESIPKRITAIVQRVKTGYKLTTQTIPSFTAVGRDVDTARVALLQSVNLAVREGRIVQLDPSTAEHGSRFGPFSKDVMRVLGDAARIALRSGGHKVKLQHVIAACEIFERHGHRDHCLPTYPDKSQVEIPVETKIRNVLAKASMIARDDSCDSVSLAHLRRALG